jgi:tripartite motif-containing protein 71
MQRFDAEGTYLSQFGGEGRGPGELLRPADVAIDPASHDVYVSEFFNQRVSKFKADGTYLSQFGE